VDERIADHVEALAELGLGKVYSHLVQEAQQIKAVAQAQLGDIATLTTIVPENGLVHTYVSLDANWYPQWVVYISVDLSLEPGGPSVDAVVQCEDTMSKEADLERKFFLRAMAGRYPDLQESSGRTFARLRLTTRNFLREPKEAAEEAGRTFAEFVRAAHGIWSA
jgi:hypothetical protein